MMAGIYGLLLIVKQEKLILSNILGKGLE